MFRQDSGYKSSPPAYENNFDTSLNEKEPLHSLDNAIIESQQLDIDPEKASSEAEDDESSFCIAPEVFAETRSSLFNFESHDNRAKKSHVQSSGWIKGGSVKSTNSAAISVYMFFLILYNELYFTNGLNQMNLI